MGTEALITSAQRRVQDKGLKSLRRAEIGLKFLLFFISPSKYKASAARSRH